MTTNGQMAERMKKLTVLFILCGGLVLAQTTTTDTAKTAKPESRVIKSAKPVSTSNALDTDKPTPKVTEVLSPEPRVDVQLLSDGKPLDWRQGLPVTIDGLAFAAHLDNDVQQKFPDLDSDIVVQQVRVSLTRGTRRIAFVDWTGGTVEKIKDPLPGDRYVIEFTKLAAKRKDGTLIVLKQEPTITVVLR